MPYGQNDYLKRGETPMQSTGYYRILEHPQNDIADVSDYLMVNCTGMNYKDNEAFYTNTSRPDFYLIYVTEGELSVTLPESSISLKSGMGIVYYPNHQYQYHFDGKGTNCYYWVHFTGFAAQATLERFGFHNESTFNIGVHSRIINLFGKIASELMSRQEDCSFGASTYLLQILLSIKRYESPHQNSKSAKRIKASLDTLHTNYHKPITIEELARIENMSPSRYRTVFREIIGISPKQYLTNIRMRRACELLRQTSLPVEQVGTMVGYEDMLYFYRIFKKKNDITPSQYRVLNNELTENSTPRSWNSQFKTLTKNHT